MKLSEINIEPLKKDEKNQLHGGFDFVSLASLDADVTNINCAKAKGSTVPLERIRFPTSGVIHAALTGVAD